MTVTIRASAFYFNFRFNWKSQQHICMFVFIVTLYIYIFKEFDRALLSKSSDTRFGTFPLSSQRYSTSTSFSNTSKYIVLLVDHKIKYCSAICCNSSEQALNTNKK